MNDLAYRAQRAVADAKLNKPFQCVVYAPNGRRWVLSNHATHESAEAKGAAHVKHLSEGSRIAVETKS